MGPHSEVLDPQLLSEMTNYGVPEITHGRSRVVGASLSSIAAITQLCCL